MSYREEPVSGALGPWAECAWIRLGAPSGDAYERIVPDGCMDLLWSERSGLVAVGANTTAFLAPIDPGRSSVGVRLQPGAAPPLFGVPAPALLDARMPARELFGAAGARLEEEVAQAANPRSRAALMVDFLAGRARRAEPDPLVRAAASRLWSAPDLKVATVARDLAVSERHLRRLVIEQVGFGPKRLGRVLRLRAALGRVRAGAELADVAHGGGYADQAHFANECRAFTGVTPSAFRPARLALG